MPFIRTSANVKITKDEANQLKCDFGSAISLVSGKNEGQLMLAFHGSTTMSFKGDDITPTAMIEVELLGESATEELNLLTAALTESVQRTLGISPEKIYVNYSFYKYWGVSGQNV